MWYIIYTSSFPFRSHLSSYTIYKTYKKANFHKRAYFSIFVFVECDGCFCFFCFGSCNSLTRNSFIQDEFFIAITLNNKCFSKKWNGKEVFQNNQTKYVHHLGMWYWWRNCDDYHNNSYYLLEKVMVSLFLCSGSFWIGLDQGLLCCY